MAREEVLLDQREQVLLAEVRGHQVLQVGQRLLNGCLRVVQIRDRLHLAQFVTFVLLVELVSRVHIQLLLVVWIVEGLDWHLASRRCNAVRFQALHLINVHGVLLLLHVPRVFWDHCERAIFVPGYPLALEFVRSKLGLRAKIL